MLLTFPEYILIKHVELNKELGDSLSEFSVFEIEKDQYDKSLVSKGDSVKRLSQRSWLEAKYKNRGWFKILEFVLPK